MGARKHGDHIEEITKSHHEMLTSAFESKAEAIDSMIYSYRHGFSGFAAKMSESQAKYFRGLHGVVEVFPNYLYTQQTTRSWDYLGLSASSTTNLVQDTNQGDGAIIGVIDTGVWPEAESFNEKGLGPIPSKWKGFCQSGDSFTPSKHCNKKLIGARYFVDGLAAELNHNYREQYYNATKNDDYSSARDKDGHGTHTASTAGGSFVSNVSVNGLARGTARGGAPKARVAMYKVLWNVDGGSSIGSAIDILKAFDEAIHDGVDVLSLSLGFDLPLYPEIDKRDIIYYGSFHAAEHGIVPVCSAGNSGPLYGTVEDVAPWVITVAASTIDRSFPNPIILGNNQVFAGQGMYIGDDTGFVDLVFFEDRKPPLPPTDPKVRLKPVQTYVGIKATSYIASFSSRGPNSLSPSVLKLAGTKKSCPKSGLSVLDLNLPSITVPNLKGSVTVTRSVTNVGNPNSNYEAVVVAPFGTTVKVNPSRLVFNAHVKKLSFTVTITGLHKTNTEYYFGSLIWTDKVHQVRIPLSVKTEFSLLLSDYNRASK
ncbi:Subtilase family protein [Perilla frutescens var. frutescens]|nr:Subtilase family protein [Perilla frutescens var. frutescens]